jgi:hypothetical protein
MQQLVEYFVDGSDVDFVAMRVLGLIRVESGGFILTDFSKSFL